MSREENVTKLIEGIEQFQNSMSGKRMWDFDKERSKEFDDAKAEAINMITDAIKQLNKES